MNFDVESKEEVFNKEFSCGVFAIETSETQKVSVLPSLKDSHKQATDAQLTKVKLKDVHKKASVTKGFCASALQGHPWKRRSRSRPFE